MQCNQIAQRTKKTEESTQDKRYDLVVGQALASIPSATNEADKIAIPYTIRLAMAPLSRLPTGDPS